MIEKMKYFVLFFLIGLNFSAIINPLDGINLYVSSNDYSVLGIKNVYSSNFIVNIPKGLDVLVFSQKPFIQYFKDDSNKEITLHLKDNSETLKGNLISLGYSYIKIKINNSVYMIPKENILYAVYKEDPESKQLVIKGELANYSLLINLDYFINFDFYYLGLLKENKIELFPILSIKNVLNQPIKINTLYFIHSKRSRYSYPYRSYKGLTESYGGIKTLRVEEESVSINTEEETSEKDVFRIIKLNNLVLMPNITSSIQGNRKSLNYSERILFDGYSLNKQIIIKNDNSSLIRGRLILFTDKTFLPIYSQIPETAENENITLNLGTPYDLKAKKEMIKSYDLDNKRVYEYKIKLKNYGNKVYNVSIKIKMSYYKLYEADSCFKEKDGYLLCDITINPNEEKILRYSLYYRYGK